MILFECDYQVGAHPRIINRIAETNMIPTLGYSEDIYCKEAAQLIKETFAAQHSDVHFLVGGTQTNMTFISSVLRPHQGVLSAHTGHINVHESGAIESTGHKVLALDSVDGTITAEQIENYHCNHWSDASFEHIVQPGMVYISFPTENGTLYSKQQLTDIYNTCQRLNLPLYIDGARLGYALASPMNDVQMTDLPQLCDAFYIGGTKQGALFGEAILINNPALKKDFRYIIKQKGGLLAKGRLLGIQFSTLFTDNLYMELSHHAVNMALKIKQALQQNNVPLLYDSYTNQQFPIYSNEQIEQLRKQFGFLEWERIDNNHCAVRFCTSWATLEEDVDKLIENIAHIAPK